MNQDELIERLKEVAEYDGKTVETENGITQVMVSKAGNVEFYQPIVTACAYHTSFDWSISVWSKAIRNVKALAHRNKLVELADFYHNCTQSINTNDPLQFFINLSDLIREIKKYN